ncbi:MAG: hypothetical protein E6J91_20370, partial [Deltaproteobacteria bacterium]
MTILVDTSASRALGFASQARTIHRLVDELARTYGGALPVQVVAFDQVTTPLYDGRADRIGAIESALIARKALGASDLGQALSWLAAHAPKSRIVMVTDGVVTAGVKTDGLGALVKQLAGRGVDRIDVALTGGIRDDEAALALAHGGLAHTGAILDLDQGVGEAARRIGLAVRTEIPVAADGARWVFPRAIAAAQSGDEVTVFVRRAAQAQQLGLAIAGTRMALSPVAVTPALLGRAFASAEITDLDHQLAKATGDAAGKLRAEIVRRSVAARVVSSQTAMLVLESDADYARYGIDRRALADILAIGPSGVELMHRAAPVVQIVAPEPRPTESRNKKPSADAKKAEKVAVDKESTNDPLAREGRDDRLGQLQEEAKPEAAMDPGGDVGHAHLTDGAGAGAGSSTAAATSPAPRDESAPAHVRLPDMPGPRSPAPAQAAPPPPPAPRPARPEPTRMPADRRVRVQSAPSEIAAPDDEVNDDGMAANRRKPALHGPLAEIERALAAGHADTALATASAWHDKAPGDVLALIGLGDALEAKHDLETAARVYGSIIDLYPARADFRRFAGERLERLGKAQRALIIDTYRRGVEQRPDHLTGHRMLAYALVRDGQYAAAFAAILDGIDRQYPANRFAGAERVLAEDVGMIAAAYLAHGGKRDEVMAQLDRRRLALPAGPSTRFIMYWETDANDVDFHIRDAHGGHAWYSHKQLASGGELYADITTGYGPECFAIPGNPKAGPYQLSINYY